MLATLPVMSKKKTKKQDPVYPPTRCPPTLRAIIKALAEQEHRSAANMGLVLLTEALMARGLWRPPEPQSDVL